MARCLVNYSSQDVARIKGLPSNSISNVLGFHGPEEVASRGRISRVRGVQGGVGLAGETSGSEGGTPRVSRPQSRMDVEAGEEGGAAERA